MSALNRGELDVSGLGVGLDESSASLPAPSFRRRRSRVTPDRENTGVCRKPRNPQDPRKTAASWPIRRNAYRPPDGRISFRPPYSRCLMRLATPAAPGQLKDSQLDSTPEETQPAARNSCRWILDALGLVRPLRLGLTPVPRRRRIPMFYRMKDIRCASSLCGLSVSTWGRTPKLGSR